MKVHLICGDIENNWILGKFANRLKDCLTKLGILCDIGPTPDYSADINHGLHYAYSDDNPKGILTMMITHVDEIGKLEFLKKRCLNVSMGICMSNDTMRWLAKMGIPKEKLSFVNPAHDECALIRPYVIGIASRVYPDGRKNEHYFNKLANDLDPRYFHFKFMGAGWESQVNELKDKGFRVTYYDRFIRNKYFKFIQSLDYYLYTGTDEGQMGFVDAAAAGVKTIVTPQGYHLDAPEALTHTFWTYDDLRELLLSFQKERERIVHSMTDWTWMAYTKKHLELWKYLLGQDTPAEYKDGLNAYLKFCKEEIKEDIEFVNKEKEKLQRIKDLHQLNIQKHNVRKSFTARLKHKISLFLNSQAYQLES